MSTREKIISPAEIAKSIGRGNPETIRAALRAGTFPIGFAYQVPGGKWIYVVPRRAWETFMQTGTIPEM